MSVRWGTNPSTHRSFGRRRQSPGPTHFLRLSARIVQERRVLATRFVANHQFVQLSSRICAGVTRPKSSFTMVVKHLPPAVKHLLTLRNPNSLPGPPAAQLNKIFTSTFNDAKQKKVEKGWLTLTVRAESFSLRSSTEREASTESRPGRSLIVIRRKLIRWARFLSDIVDSLDMHSPDLQRPTRRWALVSLHDTR